MLVASSFINRRLRLAVVPFVWCKVEKLSHHSALQSVRGPSCNAGPVTTQCPARSSQAAW